MSDGESSQNRQLDQSTIETPTSDSPLTDSLSPVTLQSGVPHVDMRPKKITIEVSYDYWESLNRRVYNRNTTMQKYCLRLLDSGLKQELNQEAKDGDLELDI